jgi:hypothetical protein
MHLLVAATVAGILIYLMVSLQKRSQENHHEFSAQRIADDNTLNANQNIVFISKGKLFYWRPGNEIEQVHSPYIQEMIDRIERRKQLHGWKENTSLNTSFTGMSEGYVNDQVEFQMSSAQLLPNNKLIYFMKDSNIGGLFRYDLDSKEELRLAHRQKLNYEDLAANRETGEILCSQRHDNAIANIAKLNEDGGDCEILTEGDTVDSAPAWMPGDNQKILYQSSGVARSQEGYAVAFGPSSIKLLDLESNKVTSVLEDSRTDHMQPKVDMKGNLYFIRRPYELPRYNTSNAVLDVLLFPFRLMRAIFHYLNFFSLMYSQKPLTSASGPKVEADLKEILVKGKRIDAEKAMSKERRVNGIPSLVPRSWELVQRTQQGENTILATNVASFDITSDDTIVYSNGYAVFQLTPDRQSRVVLRGKLIADLILS